jgi:drug/metabolite transporter (DMT)-like permease
MAGTSGGKLLNWAIFVALSLIWGSSFILIKEASHVLSPPQVASFRLLCAGLVLLPVTIRQMKNIPRNKIILVLLSGLGGNFIPAILFPLAELKIDSSLAGFINSLTPIFVIVTGILFFKTSFQQSKIAGLLIGFTGMVVLFLGNGVPDLQHFSYSALVLVAALLYSLNINMVTRYLKDISSVTIAAVSFSTLIPLALAVLFFTGFFELPFTSTPALKSLGAGFILGVLATAIGSIIFYVLLKRAGTIFSSMVMYGMPFVALMWGMLAGEQITLLQVVGLIIILCGVYLTSLKPS